MSARICGSGWTPCYGAPIDYVKWDFNRSFTDPGWPGDPYPQRLGIEHVHGLYELLGRLRAAHPGVAFESCSGGGGRIDLGVLGLTDQVWTSDNTDPLDRLAIQHGFSQLHPARVMAAWVTDSPNVMGNQRERAPLPLHQRDGRGAGRRRRPDASGARPN